MNPNNHINSDSNQLNKQKLTVINTELKNR